MTVLTVYKVLQTTVAIPGWSQMHLERVYCKGMLLLMTVSHMLTTVGSRSSISPNVLF